MSEPSAPADSEPDRTTPTPTPAPVPAPPSRRRLLAVLSLGLGALPFAAGLFATLRTGLAPASGKRPDRFPLCTLAEIPDTGIQQVTVSFLSRQGPAVETVDKIVFVTRDPATGEILALSGECTHLSCPVQKREIRVGADKKAPLSCPCHGGAFSQTGAVLAGPPPAPLRRLRLDTIPTEPDAIVFAMEI